MANELPHSVRAYMALPRLKEAGLARVHLTTFDYSQGGKVVTSREHYTTTVIVSPDDDLAVLAEILAGALEQFSRR